MRGHEKLMGVSMQIGRCHRGGSAVCLACKSSVFCFFCCCAGEGGKRANNPPIRYENISTFEEQHLQRHLFFHGDYRVIRSVFARRMTRVQKEIIAPIISFHYEMKLSRKRMRKFHTLEIRSCKVLCPCP